MRLRSAGSLIVLALSCRGQLVLAQANGGDLTAEARKFIQRHMDEVRPVEIQANLAWWDANTSGKDEDFARKEQAENRLNAALSDRSPFAQLKSLREGELNDPLLPWNELTRQATGAPLNAKAFAAEFASLTR